ncbi:MAG TPA: hypothetical protein VK689_17780 [Armatimonadota bacterium]|nr:hypothetical protein [Armatimonadota bacterium]
MVRLFGDFLLGDGLFARAFAHVTFAILDRHGEIIAPFTEVFGGHGLLRNAP